MYIVGAGALDGPVGCHQQNDWRTRPPSYPSLRGAKPRGALSAKREEVPLGCNLLYHVITNDDQLALTFGYSMLIENTDESSTPEEIATAPCGASQ